MTDATDVRRRVDPREVSSGAQLAHALTDLRMRAGRSIRDVARATGIPSATLGGYFSGRHLPPATQPHLLEQVLEELGVTDPAELDDWDEALLRARRSGAPRLAPGLGGGVGDVAASPYRGLEPFTEHEAAVFFGREVIVDDLVAAVEARADRDDESPLMVLVGPSGSGKSSVLRAGLVPRLRTRAQAPWAVSVLVPGADPMGALAAALAEVADAPRALLVVDQAEELFSPEVPPEQRRTFMRALIDQPRAARAAGRSMVVVAGLRADFYGQAASDPDLLPALQTSQVLLGAMGIDDLRRAILRPAESVGVAVDPALVDLLLRDLSPRGHGHDGYDAGALPLVSHALLATWQRHRGGQLAVSDYIAAGGIAGAVQQTAENVVAGLDEPGRAAAQWLFGQLVVVDDDGVMTRRRVRHDDLQHPDPATDLALDAAIERFVAGRLLTADEATIEISHEALLTAWPRLHEWVLDDIDAARLQRRIADAAAAWRESDRDPAALLRGGPLAAARSLAAQPPTSHRVLTGPEQEFVAASAAQDERARTVEHRRTTRLRALLAVMTALALLAGLLAGVALRSRNEAQRQEQLAAQARDEALSRQLAIAANNLRERDPALGAQLALAAFEVSPTLQARSSLLDSTGVPTPTRFVGPAGEMHAVASPDGSLLAISGVDGVTRVWKRESAQGAYQPIGELPAVGGAVSVYDSAFSPDGTLLAVGTASGPVTLWDLSDPRDPREVATLTDSGASVQALAFSPDGTQLAAGTSEPSVRRWSVPPARGAQGPRPLPAITGTFGGTVKSVAYSPDGTLLATGGDDGMIRLWSVRGGRRAALLGSTSTGAPTNFVHSVSFSPDGTLLASAEKNGVARLWDVTNPESPAPRGEPLGEFASWVNAVAFSPDGGTLAAGSSDGSVQLFTVDDGQPILRLANPAAVNATQFVGTGTALLTSEVDGVARLWPLPGPVQSGFSDSIWGILHDEDETLRGVAPGARDGAVHLYDSAEASAAPTHVALTPPARAGVADGAAAMSADGRWVAAGTATGNVTVWERDQATGSFGLSGVLELSDQLVEAATISDDGTLLAAVADDGAVGVWELTAGSAPREVHRLGVPGLPLGVALSPDASILAVSSTDATVHLWRRGDASPGEIEELTSLTGFENYVYGVTFDPTGRYLAAGSTDRTIRIWDMSDPARATPVGAPIRGPGDTVYALAWSEDAMLAGASKDGGAWLWDVTDPASPQLRAKLTAADGALYSVGFSASGQQVSAGGTSRAVVTWQVDVDTVAASTCESTGTSMTAAEWEQVAPGVEYDPPCP